MVRASSSLRAFAALALTVLLGRFRGGLNALDVNSLALAVVRTYDRDFLTRKSSRFFLVVQLIGGFVGGSI
jgi:hypothetical protein